MTQHLSPELLQGIRSDPENLSIRLVAADFFEEHGQPERAEYVRISCELDRYMVEPVVKDIGSWINFKPTPVADLHLVQKHLRRTDLMAFESKFLEGSPLLWAGWQANSTWVPSFEWEWRRGFVEEVRCSLADWYGGDCGRCKGRGKGVFGKGGAGGQTCPDCEGHGKVGGHGPEILRSEPVLTVRTEKEPGQFSTFPGMSHNGSRAWLRHTVGDELYALLCPDGKEVIERLDGATKRMSAALIRWALDPANLPDSTRQRP